MRNRAGMRALRALAGLWCVVAAAGTQAATLSCNAATTLEALVDCISKQMPQDGSNGYVAPNATQRADFRAVAAQMLQGQCAFALPASLDAAMRIRTFVDSANGRSYCVLMEVQDADGNGQVDRGWGSFITYADATREISHQAPHPKFSTDTKGSAGDSYTEREAVRIFKQTDARSYLMCGARRSANPKNSSCQRDYEAADCAHNLDNMFHTANEALDAHYAHTAGVDWTAIQWHGMAESSCRETMFMSLGFDADPPAGSKILRLRDAIRGIRPTWRVDTPDTACTLNATDNPTGRWLNGVPVDQACGTKATSPSHKFMHIEQDVPVIGADLDGVAASWAQAVNTAFPVGGTPVHLAPGADAYVRSGGKAGQNYGADKLMQVQGFDAKQRVAYLRFDIGSLATATQAVLRMQVSQSADGSPLTLTAHAVADTTWLEAALTWNNRPATGAALATAVTSGSAGYAWLEWNLTAYVQAQRALGHTQIGIAIGGSDGPLYAKLRSREAAANERPELVVTP